jgi:hypothetical protein
MKRTRTSSADEATAPELKKLKLDRDSKQQERDELAQKDESLRDEINQIKNSIDQHPEERGRKQQRQHMRWKKEVARAIPAFLKEKFIRSPDKEGSLGEDGELVRIEFRRCDDYDGDRCESSSVLRLTFDRSPGSFEFRSEMHDDRMDQMSIQWPALCLPPQESYDTILIDGAFERLWERTLTQNNMSMPRTLAALLVWAMLDDEDDSDEFSLVRLLDEWDGGGDDKGGDDKA